MRGKKVGKKVLTVTSVRLDPDLKEEAATFEINISEVTRIAVEKEIRRRKAAGKEI